MVRSGTLPNRSNDNDTVSRIRLRADSFIPLSTVTLLICDNEYVLLSRSLPKSCSRLLVDIKPDEPVNVSKVDDDVSGERGEGIRAAAYTDGSGVVLGLTEDLKVPPNE